MVRRLLILAVGAAVIGAARFISIAIREERQRRDRMHHSHETTRWEGEGGNPVVPQSTIAEGGAA